MRIGDTIASAQFILENLGYARFSSFFSERNQYLGQIVQKVGRAVLGLFVMLSGHDLMTGSLSFKVKIMVNGSLCIIISSLLMSLLLKGVQEIFKIQESPLSAKQLGNTDLNKRSDIESPYHEKSIIKFSPPGTCHPMVKVDPATKRKHSTKFSKPVRRNLLAEFNQAV
jgi:hypothetical protein